MDSNLYMSIFMLAYILIGIAYAFKERESIDELENKSCTMMSENEELIKSYSNLIQEYKTLQMEYKRTDPIEAGKIGDKIRAMQKSIEEIEDRNAVQDFSTIKKFFDDVTILKVFFVYRIAFWLPIMCWNGFGIIVAFFQRIELMYLELKYHFSKKSRDRAKKKYDREIRSMID